MNFTVERYWKGKPKRETFVFTAQNSFCSVGFADGERYLVFALVNDNGDINTNLCLRPGPVRERRQYLKLLGRGRAMKRVDIGRKHNKSLDACGGGVFPSMTGPAMGS